MSLVQEFDAQPTKDTNPGEAQEFHVWRWQRHGHGKYKGRYYRLVSLIDGHTIKGGYLDERTIATLNRIYPRKGKGNHNTGAARKTKSRRAAAGNAAGLE